MSRTAFRATALLLAAGSAVAAPEKAAVFAFPFSNRSPVPGDEADRARLDRTSAQLHDLFAKKGRFEIVPTDPVKEEVAKSADLRRCNSCAEDFVRKLGADVAIIGEVQTVSNLILNLNVYVKHLSSNVPEKAYSVDLRGDTDGSSARGIRFPVENNMGAGK